MKKYKKPLEIFIIAIISRWLVFLLGYVYLKLNGGTGGFFANIAHIFEKAGDTPHYIEIAQNWYQSTGENSNLIVFFPLYPLLMRVFYTFLRNYLLAGIVVSNLCFGVAACYMYELLKLDFNEEKSLDGLFFLLLFPFGLFYAGVYTESLFVMLCLMCLYYIRKEKMLAAGIIGFFAALTRMQGVLLIVFYIYEIVVGFVRKKAGIKEILRDSLPALLIPLGFFLYLLMNKLIYGNWFIYLKFEADKPWYNKAAWIGDNLSLSFEQTLKYFNLSLYIYAAQLIMFFVGVGALVYGLKNRVRASYIAYGLVYMGVTYLHGWMISGMRYMMACIPLYIVFASVKNKYVKGTILIFSALTYFVITLLWMKGFAIM